MRLGQPTTLHHSEAAAAVGSMPAVKFLWFLLRTREACSLLQLLPGSARLMQEMLEGAVRAGPADSGSYSAAVTALNDIGVHTLDPSQAEQILRLKINAS